MKLKFFGVLAVISLIILGANAYLFLTIEHEALEFLRYLPLVLIVNGIIMAWVIKGILSYILFPFATNILKANYHMQMNNRMVVEISSTLTKANEIIQDRMN